MYRQRVTPSGHQIEDCSTKLSCKVLLLFELVKNYTKRLQQKYQSKQKENIVKQKEYSVKSVGF